MPLTLIDNEDDFLIRLSGVIDEHAAWPETKARPRQRIVIDSASVERVNSIGLQSWSNWMRAYPDDQQFVFRGCSPRLMEDFFNVDGFLPSQFIIESFALTYECTECEHSETQLLERGKHFVEAAGGKPFRLNVPPEINCPRCRGLMQPDGMESHRLKTLEKML